MRLIVYGDLNADICLNVDKFPAPGQDVIIDQFALLPGGSAANCAAVAASLGTDVEFVGLTGKDALGHMLRDDLVAHGVGVRHLRHVDQPSGAIVTLVGQDGERTFFSYRGANALAAYGP